ncbi:MAG: transglycosylase domain-containing protein [Acidaminococcales bacterium]|jgi:penicillin-binding protein 1A|nr:transglycosylase domain-containing protein [Acidaminococcales bacterium]
MFKLLFALIFAVSLFIGYESYKPYLPAPLTENIDKLADGRLLRENTPQEVTRVLRFFKAEEEIRQKMAAPGWVKLDDIPLSMQQAIISVEDSRFYQHGSFDPGGIVRALLANLQAGEIVEGGSTITQQLAKNLFLGQEQTMARKAEEAVYSVIIENSFTKEEILETYLNIIYFGAGAYGIKDAARLYFKKRPQELTLAESAMLAGIPAAPSLYSPLKDFKAAKRRQAVVLETMVKNGFVGPQKAKELLEEKLF